MVYEGVLEGKYVDLRSATENDAEFSLSLRQNPVLTQYLPKISITEEQQRKWIGNQRNLKGDYFFVIINKMGKRIGVIGLYNIQEGVGETGRIAILGNSFQCIEAQLLSFDFAFNNLGLKKTVNSVYAENIHGVRFAKLFGSESSEIYLDKDGVKKNDGSITKDSYIRSREKITRILYRK